MKHLEEVIINYDKKLMEANNEIERLHSIIKEARDTLEEYKYINVEDYGRIIDFYKKIKNILEKENK